MDKYNTIIIEDEPLALERTKQFVEKLPSLSLLGTFEDAISGLNFLQNNEVDILFLDINMDELSGIELLESVKITSEVIITTAYPQYALKGYELNITDYLLKPYDFNRFIQATNKAIENIKNKGIDKHSDFVFIKTENRLEKVIVNDIVFIEGMRDYRRIHLSDRKIMTLQNFSFLEEILPSHLICRVHKSYMVAINKIESIERNRIRIKDLLIPISESYKTSFYKLI